MRPLQTGSSMTSFLLADRPALQADGGDDSSGEPAQLRMQFARDPHGRTFLRGQHASYPFHICRALYHDTAPSGLATLYIQSCSGGLFENDRLIFEIDAAAGARAHVTTQASTVVHSMTSGSAVQLTRIRAAPGAYLEYLPDPQILFPQSSLASKIHIRLEGNAVVLVCDSFLMHDPSGANATFTTFLSETEIVGSDGKCLTVDRTRFEGNAIRARYPGIMGAFNTQGSVIAATTGPLPDSIWHDLDDAIPADSNVIAGLSRLPNSSGLVVRILASDGAELRRALRKTCSALRLALTGHGAPNERK